MESRVKKLIAEILGADESKITNDARFFEDLRADSLDMVELLMAAEDDLGCDITDAEAEKVVTVRDAIELMRRVQP